MTEPLSYTVRTIEPVQAMLFDGSPASAAAIGEWVTPLLAEGQTFAAMPYGAGVQIYGGDLPAVIAERNNYLYLDEDGFHSVGRGAFELLMKVNDGI